ncbi:hypothetical protein [Anaerocolumna aminovalerica]|nr:hypothetical protein [Anaerocolumna aminovalerica]
MGKGKKKPSQKPTLDKMLIAYASIVTAISALLAIILDYLKWIFD